MKIQVYADEYLNNPEKYKSNDFITYEPVDLNGTFVPTSKSKNNAQKVIESVNYNKLDASETPKVNVNTDGFKAYKS